MARWPYRARVSAPVKEGFGTPGLREAAALLGDLGVPTHAAAAAR